MMTIDDDDNYVECLDSNYERCNLRNGKVVSYTCPSFLKQQA